MPGGGASRIDLAAAFVSLRPRQISGVQVPITDAEARFITDTREYFSNIGLWPERPRHVNPEGWLSNFSEGTDRALAASLLDSFLLIRTDQCQTMATSAFHGLSASRGDVFAMTPAQHKNAWADFRSTVIVTFPARRSDPAGSGHIFARAARSWVSDPDAQVMEPGVAAKHIASAPHPCIIVFVDDFAGSGNQFCDTWMANFASSGSGTLSFSELANEQRLREVYFIPAISTWRAKMRIAGAAPIVAVKPAHVLPPRYSAAEDNHTLVPAKDRAALTDLLKRYAEPAGYDPANPFGYEACGLAISFEHATPDNTLPIFNGGPNRPATWRSLRSN